MKPDKNRPQPKTAAVVLALDERVALLPIPSSMNLLVVERAIEAARGGATTKEVIVMLGAKSVVDTAYTLRNGESTTVRFVRLHEGEGVQAAIRIAALIIRPEYELIFYADAKLMLPRHPPQCDYDNYMTTGSVNSEWLADLSTIYNHTAKKWESTAGPVKGKRPSGYVAAGGFLRLRRVIAIEFSDESSMPGLLNTYGVVQEPGRDVAFQFPLGARAAYVAAVEHHLEAVRKARDEARSAQPKNHHQALAQELRKEIAEIVDDSL